MGKNENKKEKTFRNVILGIVGIIIIVVGFGFYYVNNMINKVEKVKVNEENIGINKELDDKLSTEFGDIQNIALFGLDSGTLESGRSDSMMILTIDRKNKKLKLTSLMRDSYVNLKGKKDKLNHAYAYGGPELAMKTINENFDLNIKDFITVNFDSLPKIIDKIGGVSLDIDASEVKYINGYIKDINRVNKTNSPEITKPGVYDVDGTQAMAYCRIRYTEGGDYKRTERHREVLDAIFKKVQTISVSKYPTLLNEVLPMVKTSLSSSDILTIGADVVKIGGNFEQGRFPKDNASAGKTINKVWYLTYDEAQTKKDIYEWIFEDKN